MQILLLKNIDYVEIFVEFSASASIFGSGTPWLIGGCIVLIAACAIILIWYKRKK